MTLKKTLFIGIIFVIPFFLWSNEGDDFVFVEGNNLISDFYICKHEVTQEEFVAVTNYNPSLYKGEKNPVEKVSWNFAIDYCNKRSVKEGLTPCYTIKGNDVTLDLKANGYRLPTESEWEYAAKGGKKSQNYKFSGSNDPKESAWHGDNSASSTHEVMQKKANELGIYDMSGNVNEWCWDWYDYEDILTNPDGNTKDYTGPDSGRTRVFRGGSFNQIGRFCTVSERNCNKPDTVKDNIGLRVVRSAVK